MNHVQFSVVMDVGDATNGPRLGTLKLSESKIDTPAFMFYTKVNIDSRCLWQLNWASVPLFKIIICRLYNFFFTFNLELVQFMYKKNLNKHSRWFFS
jgi:queuine/archaeosine tRNA-ribosyltransferase